MYTCGYLFVIEFINKATTYYSGYTEFIYKAKKVLFLVLLPLNFSHNFLLYTGLSIFYL